MNFIDLCIKGLTITDDIEEYIEQWRRSTGELSVHEFLGMSLDEYDLWLNNPEVLDGIVCRKKKFLR